jgi:DNA-binding transcriptional LysR family regulator
MELTHAGQVLYDKAEFFFNYLNETITEVRDTGVGLRGKLTVGCVKTCFSYLPGRIKTFRETYPEITFELREGDSHYLAEQLKNRQIDLAVVRLPVEMKPFSGYDLPEEKNVIIMPGSWGSDFNKNSMTIEELADYPLVLLKRLHGSGPYEVIIDKFKERDLDPNVVTICPDVGMVYKLVSSEVGATILPASTLEKNTIGGIKVFEMEDECISSSSALIWLKDRYLPKSAERFIELFKDNV